MSTIETCVQGDNYQIQFIEVWLLAQVLFEAGIIHVLIDKTVRVYLGGVQPYEERIDGGKETACLDFVAVPLGRRSPTAQFAR